MTQLSTQIVVIQVLGKVNKETYMYSMHFLKIENSGDTLNPNPPGYSLLSSQSMRWKGPIGILTLNHLALPLATRVVECPHGMHFEQ